MKLENRETDNFYTVEMDKEGEEFLICYWCFDTLEEAQEFLNVLKNGCTAYNINVTIFDNLHQLIERWKLGSENKQSVSLRTKSGFYAD